MKVFAKDVMETKVKTVGRDLALTELERQLVDAGISGCPVVAESGDVVGVVSARDVLAHMCEKDAQERQLTVADMMSTDVVAVSPEAPLHEVAALMTEKKIHRILVLEDKKLVGIVSSSDIVKACGNDRIDISFTPPEILDF